jgi:hypothetical protein
LQETSEAMPTETKATAGNGAEKGPSKTEMVRQAMEKGRKRKPLSIQEWVQQKYNVFIEAAHISTIKSNLRNKSKKPRKSSAEAPEAAAAPRRKSNAESLSLEEIRLVKGLVDRIGRDNFKQVVELLG